MLLRRGASPRADGSPALVADRRRLVRPEREGLAAGTHADRAGAAFCDCRVAATPSSAQLGVNVTVLEAGPADGDVPLGGRPGGLRCSRSPARRLPDPRGSDEALFPRLGPRSHCAERDTEREHEVPSAGRARRASCSATGARDDRSTDRTGSATYRFCSLRCALIDTVAWTVEQEHARATGGRDARPHHAREHDIAGLAPRGAGLGVNRAGAQRLRSRPRRSRPRSGRSSRREAGRRSRRP